MSDSLSILNGAKLVRVFSDGTDGREERVYAWFGGSQVHVYQWQQERLLARLVEVDVFTNYNIFNSFCVEDAVDLIISEHEDALFDNDEHTDDIFYDYEFEEGVDLETQ